MKFSSLDKASRAHSLWSAAAGAILPLMRATLTRQPGAWLAATSVVLACSLLTGCAAYDPPYKADHASVSYQKDLRRCRAPADLRARQIAGNTPLSAMRSIFTSDEPERQEIRTCMQARGYVLP